MAKSLYFIGILLGISLSSCDHFSNSFGTVREVELGDTTRYIKYETRYTTVYDTVLIEVPAPNNKRKAFVDTLKHYIGLTEATGNNDGYHIQKFTRVACNAERVMWCAAVVGYGLEVNGHEIPELGCWSPAYFPKDKVVWKQGDKGLLEEGHIFGMYFKSKGRIAHCGIILEDYGKWKLTLEGNTNDAGSRDGNGMFVRLRHESQIYKVSDWI